MRKSLSLLVLAVLVAGCGRPPGAPRAESLPRTLPLDLLADRAPDVSLTPARRASAPAARLVLLRIAPERERAAPPPEASPAEPPVAAAEPERLPSDDRLRPPVPRASTLLRLAGARGRWVELDVRVDESGAVSDVEIAGGDADSALVNAAIAATRATRWYPARRAGRAVAVWSRQRLEVAR
jgi:TonB family protein